MNVVLGEYDKKKRGRDCVTVDGQTECTGGHLTIPIQSVTVHEKYVPSSHDYDIALIKLKKNAPYRGKPFFYYRAICSKEENSMYNLVCLFFRHNIITLYCTLASFIYTI